MEVNFIYNNFIEDLDLCDNIITYFENNDQKYQGESSHGVNLSFKESTDCHMTDKDLFDRYTSQLINVAKQYIEIFPFSDNLGPWGITEFINIQKYEPSQAFHAWHTERDGSGGHLRHLAFMTYLNDVSDGGETEFYHQEIKVKPQKGLTLIWPVDWTHVHRGKPSPTQTKYITTGWFSFLN